METDRKAPATIDAYIAGFPEDVQAILQQVRLVVREAAPDAVETIKYGMPTLMLNGNLVHFAAYRKHIALYPTPAGTEEFQEQLSPYRAEKSTLRFPLDRPVPFDLIGQIVGFLVAERAAAQGKQAYGSRKGKGQH